MKEILVHLSAPTSHKDDERYRRLANAYDEFEPASTVKPTTRHGGDSDVVSTDNQPAVALLHDDPETLANEDALTSNVTQEGPSVHLANQTPSTTGFVAPTQVTPFPRRSARKGKKLELFAQAPDFGSFTSTSRTPIQQLHEIERRWLQERSSTKRSASGLSKTRNTPSKDSLPLYIENTQEALASLEDHIESSSFGGWPSSSQSPVMQRPSKKPRLSPTQQPPEASRTDQHVKNQVPGFLPTPSTFSPLPPPRTPTRDINSSQMPDSYNLSNSQLSSFYGSYPSGPVSQNSVAPDGSTGAGFSQDGRANYEPYQLQSPVTGTAVQEKAVVVSQQSHPVMPEESHDSPSVEQTTTNSDASVVDPVPQPEDFDFGPLPLQLWSKPEAVGKKRGFNEVTSMMETYVSKASITKHYRPASVSRPIEAAERGCWMFDTADWEPKRQHEFWTRMQYMVGEGYFGNVWCQRNVPKNWRSGGTDGNEAEGLGVVWLFCWGQVVPHIWVVLLVESHLQIRKSRARWTVGPMEKLEVVVQMP